MGEGSSGNSPNRVIRFLTAPFRALVRARDAYVRGLSGCSVAMPRSRSRGFPRLAPASTSDDDLRDLIRISKLAHSGPRGGVVPRSQSVAPAIGRIDEDRPSNFDGDDVKLGVDSLYPRSRSCAVVDQRKVRFNFS